MAVNVPIRDIPGAEGTPNASSLVAMDNGISMQKTTVKKVVDAGAPVASQAEAEGGTDNDKRMSALRVKQAIAAQVGVTIASKSQGDKADTAVQPGALGSAAVEDASAFATATQGGKADTAVQPDEVAPVLSTATLVSVTDALSDLQNVSDNDSRLSIGGNSYSESLPLYFAGKALVGDGGTIENTTLYTSESALGGAIEVGNLHPALLNELTYYECDDASAGEDTLTLATSDDASNFAVGDVVWIRGQGYYEPPGLTYPLYIYGLLTTITDITSGVLKLEHTFDEDVVSGGGITGPEVAVVPTNTTDIISTDHGDPIFAAVGAKVRGVKLVANHLPFGRGGMLKCDLSDIEVDAKGLFVVNSFAHSRASNIRGKTFRNGVELAGNCHRSSVLGVGGDYYPRSGVTPFAQVIVHEESRDITVDGQGLVIDMSRISAANARCARFGAGRRNIIKNYKFLAKSVASTPLSFQSFLRSGGTITQSPLHDCEYDNIEVIAGSGAPYFVTYDAEAGAATITRCGVRNSRFFGSPSIRAANLNGEAPYLINNWFEDGGVSLSTGTTKARIIGNYIPDGLINMTDQLWHDNPDIHGNTSNASIAAVGASLRDTNSVTVTSTTANNVVKSTTFPSACLAVGDTIEVVVKGVINGTTSTKDIRLTVGGSNAFDTQFTAAQGGVFELRGVIDVRSDTQVRTNLTALRGTGPLTEGFQITVPALSSNSLAVALEAWVANAADSVFIYEVVIVARKRGFVSL